MQPAPGARATVFAVAPDDSLADQEVLFALDALEFRSLDRRADRVRGQVTPPLVTAAQIGEETARLFGSSRGGAASAAGPIYDIDVASFANHARVQYYVDFFLGPARDRFTIWLGRLHRYDGMIRQHLRLRGVPEDMVYLALIESGYSNTAVSRAQAVGMWQFMINTGRGYGLHVDTWVDERRDPFKATDAAARHLSDLNDRFGSWYLAAAAYNAGAGRVSRGIQRLPGRPESLSDNTFFRLYEQRYLRLETRDYVPKLIAAALIAKEPERFGFDIVPLLDPFVFDEITVTDATGLDVIARLAGTTARALAELNPQFIRGVTPPNRTVVVRVPRGSGAEVAQRWAELPPNERVSFVEHVVQGGESLSLIAQRYGVTVPLLTAANPGVQPLRLRIGQRLVVPISQAARGAASVRRAPAPAPSAAVPVGGRHVVRQGESLWSISQRYGVTIANLRTWNGLGGDDMIRVGQRLVVRAPSPSRASR